MTAATQLFNNTRKPNIRPIEIQHDLMKIADLVELCFSDSLDADGRRYVHQMRASARSGTFVGVAGRLAQPLKGFVWEEDGNLIGNLNLLPVTAVKKRAYLIANVAVHPDSRRKGIANALTDAGLDYIYSRGVRSVWLQVDESNSGALSLYQKVGFAERARRTTWHSKRNSPQEEGPTLSQEIQIRPRKSSDWLQQKRWLNQNYAMDVRWHLPLKSNLLRPNFTGVLTRIFSDKRIKQWSAWQGSDHIGSIAWQSSYTQADWLWMAVSKEAEHEAIVHLLNHTRQALPTRRTLAVNYNSGVKPEAFQAAGFRNHQTLIWMHITL